MSEQGEPQNLELAAVRQILDEYFAGGDLAEALDGTPPEVLFASIADSEKARRYFNRLALTDRALSSGELEEFLEADLEEAQQILGTRPGGDFERDLGTAAFDAKLDAMLEEEAAGEASTRQSHSARGGGHTPDDPEETTVVSLFGGSQGIAATLAAAALAVLVLGVVLMRRGGDAADEFNPRSAATASDSANFARPDLELFCVRRADGDVEFEGTTDVAMGALECPMGAELKLAYRNPSKRLQYAAFFGIAADGSAYWYGPTPATPRPVEVRSTEKLVPFGETIRLNVNHSPGRVRVHAIFSTQPIGFDQLRQRLSTRPRERLWEGGDLSSPENVATDRVFEVVDEAPSTEETP